MGRQTLRRTIERRENISESHGHKPRFVEFRRLATDTEAGKDDKAECDADPAIEDHGALGGDQDDGVPFGAVHSCPGIWLQRETGVLVKDVELDWQDDDQEDQGEREKAEEARFIEAG